VLKTHGKISGSRHALFASLFVIIPLVLAVFFFLKGAVSHPFPWTSATWEHVNGSVTGVDVALHGPMSMWEESGKYSRFKANVAYQYELNGRAFAGSDASFVLERYLREHIDRPEVERRAHERFPAGAQVSVFFDPDDPSRSTLQPGINSNATGDFLIGGACLVFAAWQFWVYRRTRS